MFKSLNLTSLLLVFNAGQLMEIFLPHHSRRVKRAKTGLISFVFAPEQFFADG
jgi:hypothetical protein